MPENDIVLTYDPVDLGLVEVTRVAAPVGLDASVPVAALDASVEAATLDASRAATAAATSQRATLAATTTDAEAAG